MMNSVWSGRRVFLTGHTGLKGGWLALYLACAGATIRGYALDPATTPSLFHSAKIDTLLEDIRGDIRDHQCLRAAMQTFQPEVVFHLAAQPLVRRSYADPLETYATNVMGTAHLLEAMRGLPSVRAAVIVTTDKCYVNREWHWGYRETDALGGHDPYSSSKACVEILSASYRSSFFSRPTTEQGLLLATARAGNVIGGGDWSEDRLLPDLVRGFIRREAVPIRRPSAVRPWQHVLEPIAGYVMLAERLLAGEREFADAWNFGPSDEDSRPVGRIATTVAEQWGDGAAWFKDCRESAHEAGYLKLDSSKAHAELGWRPRLGIESALEWTVDWYRKSQTAAEMQAFTFDQITTYEKLA